MNDPRPPRSAAVPRDPASPFSEERDYRRRNNPGGVGMGGYGGRSASMEASGDPAGGSPHHPEAVGLHELRARWRQDEIDHRHATDPDYARWRDEHAKALDDDYDAWRQERYRSFSDDFGAWRSARVAGRTDKA